LFLVIIKGESHYYSFVTWSYYNIAMEDYVKNSWTKAYFAEILFKGSFSSIFLSKSNPK